MKFQASLDAFAKIITITISFVFTWTVIFTYKRGQSEMALLFLLMFSLTYLVCYLFSVKSYELKDTGLIIHRPLAKIIFAKEEIESIRQVEKDEMKWTFRTFGNGGLFGYTGKFANTHLGSMTYYATQRRNYVLLQTRGGKKIILTPDQPGDLVAATNAQLSLTGATS